MRLIATAFLLFSLNANADFITCKNLHDNCKNPTVAINTENVLYAEIKDRHILFTLQNKSVLRFTYNSNVDTISAFIQLLNTGD